MVVIVDKLFASSRHCIVVLENAHCLLHFLERLRMTQSLQGKNIQLVGCLQQVGALFDSKLERRPAGEVSCEGDKDDKIREGAFLEGAHNLPVQ